MLDKNRPYSRLEIDKVFNKVKATMHAEALVRGKAKGLGNALYQDIYTGKTLIGGDDYAYDHIRSAEAIHSKYKAILTDEQIAQVVNCPENVGTTLASINISKGKKNMEDWLSNSNNISNYNIDLNLTKVNLKNADKGIERKANELK